jgi:SPP1 family predicted phage head-tail adaptor
MRAGKLDRRLTIQRVTTVPGPFNEPVETWTDVATVWAQERPDRGTERFSAQGLTAQVVMVFHIRYRADVTVEDRLLYKERTWNIIDVAELGRRVVTEIYAVARAEG